MLGERLTAILQCTINSMAQIQQFVEEISIPVTSAKIVGIEVLHWNPTNVDARFTV